MIYKFEFKNDNELNLLIKENEDKHLIEVNFFLDKNNIAIFSTEPKPLTLEEILTKKISILEAENATLREGLQAVLSGDMQSLAYILYPEDFTNIDNSKTTLEL